MSTPEIVFTVMESPQGGYEARALAHSIFTHADSVDELREEIREAVHCHFEGEDLPAAIRLRFLRDEVISA